MANFKTTLQAIGKAIGFTGDLADIAEIGIILTGRMPGWGPRASKVRKRFARGVTHLDPGEYNKLIHLMANLGGPHATYEDRQRRQINFRFQMDKKFDELGFEGGCNYLRILCSKPLPTQLQIVDNDDLDRGPWDEERKMFLEHVVKPYRIWVDKSITKLNERKTARESKKLYKFHRLPALIMLGLVVTILIFTLLFGR